MYSKNSTILTFTILELKQVCFQAAFIDINQCRVLCIKGQFYSEVVIQFEDTQLKTHLLFTCLMLN